MCMAKVIIYTIATVRMAAGSRLPRSSHGFFLLSPTFQTYVLSTININILGLYKAFWYTGSAFTRYFNHNHNNSMWRKHSIICKYVMHLFSKHYNTCLEAIGWNILWEIHLQAQLSVELLSFDKN